MPAMFRRDKTLVVSGLADEFTGAGAASGLSVEQIVRRRMIMAEYQPVVRLDDGEIVGFEVFSRPPAGSCFESAEALWEAADEVGLRAELDQSAHAAAYRDVLAARLHPSVSLLVKADPRELALDTPPDLAHVVGLAVTRVRVFVTISADDVLAAPARAQAGIAKARESGWGIAWNQHGLSRAASTLIPVVRPDVVMVDVAVLHAADAASLLDPVRTYAEETGASIMVSGIRSDAELHLGLAAGASLGQGCYHGGRGPIPSATAAPRHPAPILRTPDEPAGRATPYEILNQVRVPVGATADMLTGVVDQLIRRCSIDPEPPAIFVTAPAMSEQLHNRLAAIAANAGLLVVFTPEPPVQAPPGVRFVAVDAVDPLAREWSLTVVGPHFCALLAARDDRPDQMPYQYSYALSHLPGLVVPAARALLGRITDEPGSPGAASPG